MKQITFSTIPILALMLSTGVIAAQTVSDSENPKSVPVNHLEFDYFNYGVMAGQGTAYINMLMGLRYNLEDSLFDVGGEFIFGSTPHPRYDPLELQKGDVVRKNYLMLGSVAHYNFRRGRNVSFYAGLGIGGGLGTQHVFINCTVDPEGKILENWDIKRYFVAALTPRFGVELYRHFRIGLQVRIPTDGEVTVGPSISFVIGGGKKVPVLSTESDT